MPLNNSTSLGREEYLRKKRNRRRIKYLIIFLILTAGVSLSSYIAHRPSIRVSRIILSGGVLVTEEEVQMKSLDYMKGSHVWLYPKNNAIWYPRKSLEEYLKNTFKRIDTISIHRENSRTLKIDITERKPLAIWCGEVRPSLNEGGNEATTPKCFFMDQNSTIFSTSPYFSGDAYFKYYGLVATDTPIGMQYIASTTLFAEISDFIETTRKLSLRPQYLIAKSEGEFSLVISGGGEIYFDTKEPLSQASQNLESLLRTPALSTSTTRDLPIEYIDLRYGNKLFYKLK